MSKKRGTLNVKLETKLQLADIKSPGQSYDGIIQEVVKFWLDKKNKKM